MKSLVKNIALIPARAGSKRLPGKNVKLLCGLPLISYTISATMNSELFDEIIVSTDCEYIAEVAQQFGATVPVLRPSSLASDSSLDIQWINHALSYMAMTPLDEVNFVAILRPTSPLRTSKTICKALDFLESHPWADSLRGMEPASQNPGKMWIVDSNQEAFPYLPQIKESTPTHDQPTQLLPKVWIQNASLEIVKMKTLLETNSISGRRILSFELPGYEGFDINTQEDWDFLESILIKEKDLLVPPKRIL